MSETVFVGLSGGVDSATSAALLQRQGWSVVGVFIKIWRPEFIECAWRQDRLDAMRAAAALSIPFREIDLSEAYKKEVAETMVADYARGVTPNPDVLCNEKIKFGAFMHWALQNGADFVATGHYARLRLRYAKATPGGQGSGGQARVELLRGIDADKDQSYFLHRLKEKDLSRILFPVGGLRKPEVRKLALDFDLPVAEKPDSQGLCFVGDVSMRDFLKHLIPVKSGVVIDSTGKAIGEHEGAALYTIGQRHGLALFGKEAELPHYVIAIDIASNTITVSSKKEDASRASIVASELHWIGEPPSQGARLEAQVRYREKPGLASIALEGDRCQVVHFDEPRIASPGQSVVFYDGEKCLGGGVIVNNQN